MSASRLRGFYSYLNRQFRINSQLFHVVDSRRSPVYCKEFVLWAWLWGFCCGLRSTEAIQRLLRPTGLQRWLCGPEGHVLSADVLGDALEKIEPLSLEKVAHRFFFRSCRMGQFKDGGPAGLRAAAIDVTELFHSEHVHCERCMVREKTVKRGGEERVVKEYYHRAVQLLLLGTDIAWAHSMGVIGSYGGRTDRSDSTVGPSIAGVRSTS